MAPQRAAAGAAADSLEAYVDPVDRDLPPGWSEAIPQKSLDLLAGSDSEEINIFRLGKRTRTVLHKHRTGILEFVRTQRNVTIRDLPDATQVVESSPTWSYTSASTRSSSLSSWSPQRINGAQGGSPGAARQVAAGGVAERRASRGSQRRGREARPSA